MLFRSQQLNDSQHKLREMEGKANTLHAQNIKLHVQIEELSSRVPGELSSRVWPYTMSVLVHIPRLLKCGEAGFLFAAHSLQTKISMKRQLKRRK